MKVHKRRLLERASIMLLVLGLCVTAAFFTVISWPRHFAYEPTRIDSRLSGLSEPYQHIYIVGYDRPNTVGVAIFDAQAIHREFCVQYSPSAAHATPVIIVGGPSVTDRPESIAANYHDTRNRLLTIMHEYGRLDQQTEGALATLTDSWLDYARYRWTEFRDDFNWMFNYLVFNDKGI